jgi:hypothetical protein
VPILRQSATHSKSFYQTQTTFNFSSIVTSTRPPRIKSIHLSKEEKTEREITPPAMYAGSKIPNHAGGVPEINKSFRFVIAERDKENKQP